MEGIKTAISIWQLLNITEEQYDKCIKHPLFIHQTLLKNKIGTFE
jgi:hypothetical protein